MSVVAAIALAVGKAAISVAAKGLGSKASAAAVKFVAGDHAHGGTTIVAQAVADQVTDACVNKMIDASASPPDVEHSGSKEVLASLRRASGSPQPTAGSWRVI